MTEQKQTIWSERVRAGGAGYFLDVRETGKGRVFLSMAQSRKADGGGWKSERIVVFESCLEPFRKAFLSALEIMDREAGERRRAVIDEVRKAHPRAFEKWTPEDDALFERLHGDGTSAGDIAAALGRTERAIRMRIEGRDAVLASEGRGTARPFPEGAGEPAAAEGVSTPGSGSPAQPRGRHKAARTDPPL